VVSIRGIITIVGFGLILAAIIDPSFKEALLHLNFGVGFFGSFLYAIMVIAAIVVFFRKCNYRNLSCISTKILSKIKK
jgi:hypothetical protein